MEQSCNEAVKSILSCVEKYKSLIVEVEQTIWKNLRSAIRSGRPRAIWRISSSRLGIR